MLEITFGKIEDGWAQTWFDFGTQQRLEVWISYLGEPFFDFADLAMDFIRGQPTHELTFTDE